MGWKPKKRVTTESNITECNNTSCTLGELDATTEGKDSSKPRESATMPNHPCSWRPMLFDEFWALKHQKGIRNTEKRPPPCTYKKTKAQKDGTDQSCFCPFPHLDSLHKDDLLKNKTESTNRMQKRKLKLQHNYSQLLYS